MNTYSSRFFILAFAVLLLITGTIARYGIRPLSLASIGPWPQSSTPSGNALVQEVAHLYPKVVCIDANGSRAVDYAALAPILLEDRQHLTDANNALRRQLVAQQHKAEVATARFEHHFRTLGFTEAQFFHL